MPIDSVLALQSIGYTEREAAFLYLVAIHSGYFLRRQFDYFINRQRGAIAQHFLRKAQAVRHIEVIDYGESRYVYHIFAKPIYRLLGNAESQNRRRKGDGQIRARLITLDYILENDRDHYLASPGEKLRFFIETRRIPRENFADINGRLLSWLASVPVAIADRMHPASSLVRLIFTDEALLTEQRFRRFLTSAEPFLRSISNFEVIYASNSAHNFPAAEEVFWKHFAARQQVQQYALSDDWRQESRTSGIAQMPTLHAKFTTVLFKYHYPPLRRKETPSLSSVRPSGLTNLQEMKLLQRIHTERGSGAG
jgi:hypothetical protein